MPKTDYQAMADEYERHQQELRLLGIVEMTDEALEASREWVGAHPDWRAYRHAWVMLNDHKPPHAP
jgi:hypothetical protein